MKRLMTIFGAMLVVLVSPVAVMAATAAAPKPTPTPTPVGATTASPGQGLELSPPVIEQNGDPGTSITVQIRVRNVSSGTLIASGKADDFGAGTSEDGKPQLLLDENGETRYSLKYWIASVPSLTLAPSELKTASVTIKIPANAEPGGHFGVIRFTAVPPNLQGTGVSLSASVGTLVLLRVSGAITDKLTVASFTSSQSGHNGKFFEHGPVGFTLRLQNQGSVHELPTGTITVKNMLGQVTSKIAVNPLKGNVLPGSIRRFDQMLAKKQLFGYYTASFSGQYLDDNHLLTSKISFWVIPWKLLLLALAALLVLLWLLRLAIKRYNAFIISQARKR